MSDNTNSAALNEIFSAIDEAQRMNRYNESSFEIGTRVARLKCLADAYRTAIARQAAPEAPASDQHAAAASAICQTCQGSGEGKMLVGGGPDAYEIDSNCSDCGGIGEIAMPAATTASASTELILPPLPEKIATLYTGNYWTGLSSANPPGKPLGDVYTAEQVRQAQRDAYALGYATGRGDAVRDYIDGRTAGTAKEEAK